ncbi:MAG: DUF167 family protein [Proteobacteria bacterium]|nr:DUF167 family protein [Pseudomonadota bacterium]
MSASPITIRDGFVLLTVRLTPNARQERLDGVSLLADGRAVLAAKVRAVPEDGAANEALVKLLAGVAGVPKSRISLVSGHSQRIKVLRIEGDGAEIAARLTG